MPGNKSIRSRIITQRLNFDDIKNLDCDELIYTFNTQLLQQIEKDTDKIDLKKQNFQN